MTAPSNSNTCWRKTSIGLEAFVEQLATYALRRVMTIDDAPHIRAIAADSRNEDYRLRAVIQNLVTSPLFLQR